MIERKLIFERLNRLVRAVIDCKGHDRDSVGTKTALELARALAAQSWEGRPTQLTQIPSIGPVGMRKLASKDIRTVLQLADKDYDELERLMSRQPPFGKSLQAQLDKFPRLAVEAVVVGHRVHPKSDDPVLIEVKATLRYLNRKGPPNWSNRMPALTFLAETGNGTLVYFWRGSIRKLDQQAGFDLKFSVGLRHVGDRVFCHFSCEEIVGTITSMTIDHNLPASVFPIRQVMTNEIFEQEYIDNDGLDDSDLILATEQAVVQSSTRQGAETGGPKQDAEDYPSVEELVEMSCSHSADNFDNHLAGHDGEEEIGSTQMAIREPVRLPNGKWQCNHPCSGGAPTRSGKPCGHRCCKEGLDKPRRRPLQRQKRNAEEMTGDPVNSTQSQPRPSQGQPQQQLQPLAGNHVKRQKIHTAPSFTQTTLAPEARQTLPPKPKHFDKAPKNDWGSVDFDELGVECIDLSFTDDEADDIFQSLGTSAVTSHGSDANTLSTKEKQVLDQAKAATPTRAESRRPAKAAILQPDYQDKDLDDEDFSFPQDHFPSYDEAIAISTENTFESGAGGEVLYQGRRGPFAGPADSPSEHGISNGMTTAAPGLANPDNSSTPFSPDDTPGMTSDPSPSSSAVANPIATPPKNAGEETNSVGSGADKQANKSNDEPD